MRIQNQDKKSSVHGMSWNVLCNKCKDINADKGPGTLSRLSGQQSGVAEIWGIDPASSTQKGKTTVCYGGNIHSPFFLSLCASCLMKFTASRARRSVIAWDSPLTGPPNRGKYFNYAVEKSLTQRRIETFFSLGSVQRGEKHLDNSINEKKVFSDLAGCIGKSINVKGYSGLPLWTISQAVLGLPRIGKWQCQNDAVSLVLKQSQVRNNRINIIEVHPGIALFCLLQPSAELSVLQTSYKKKTDECIEILKVYANAFPANCRLIKDAAKNVVKITESGHIGPAHMDDYLDAFVCWSIALQFHLRDNAHCIGDYSGCLWSFGNTAKAIQDVFLGSHWE